MGFMMGAINSNGFRAPWPAPIPTTGRALSFGSIELHRMYTPKLQAEPERKIEADPRTGVSEPNIRAWIPEL